MAGNLHRADRETESKRRLAGGQETAGWGSTGVPQPTFVVRSRSELQGRILNIRPGTQVLGRESNCELCIDDGFVSRRHAMVVLDKDAAWIEDAGSANGTSLNGEQLPEGRRRPLRSGDVVRVGRMDLVYLDGSETPTRRSALVGPPEGAPPVEVLSRSSTDDTPLLQQRVRAAPGPKKADVSPLTPVRLAVSAAAASVAALILSSLQVAQLGAAAGAALTTVVTTFLQTHGRSQWLRVAAGAGLAFALAVTGITLPELALGRALTDPDRPATFVPSELAPRHVVVQTTEPPAVLGIRVDPTSVSCEATAVGQAVPCSPVTIESTGSAPLRVTSLELTGPAAGDFQVNGTACQGTQLVRGDEPCTVEVLFQPQEAGPRSATLIVHQNLPKPDRGTPVELTGQGIGEPTTT
jgi:FHA domain